MPAKFDPRVHFLRSVFFTAIVFLLLVTRRTLQKRAIGVPMTEARLEAVSGQPGAR
jgi:hypothetical protein